MTLNTRLVCPECRCLLDELVEGKPGAVHYWYCWGCNSFWFQRLHADRPLTRSHRRRRAHARVRRKALGGSDAGD